MRTEQRRAAVWALYQSDLLGRPLEETLPRDVHRFTLALAEQVREHQPELDELIRRYSSGWTLERIAPLERSILRVGLLEMLHPDVLPGEQPIPPRARSTRRSRPPSASAAPGRRRSSTGSSAPCCASGRPVKRKTVGSAREAPPSGDNPSA